jgi:hypothetical protein
MLGLGRPPLVWREEEMPPIFSLGQEAGLR